MAKKLIKSVRVRLSNANIDERLGSLTNSNGLKGGLSDAKVSIYDDNNHWVLDWISIGNKNDDSSFRERKENTDTVDSVILDFVISKAKIKINQSGSNLDPVNYYEIIQDPWQDNPPKKRSFGNDPYYLNNGAKISILWMIRDKFSLPVGSVLVNYPIGSWIGGLNWSDLDGNEKLDGSLSSGVWLNPDKGLNDNLEVYLKSGIKKYLYIESPDGSEKFTNTDVNIVDFVKTENDTKNINEWGNGADYTNTDSIIIKAIIDIWRKKVPNYDKLALCEPSFYPTKEIEYMSPFGSTASEVPISSLGETQSTASPDTLQLNVKLPDVLNVRSKTDMPNFTIYIGDIPTDDPDNIFTDEIEQFLQDDDEFVEDSFQGVQEYFEIAYKEPSLIGPDDFADPDGNDKGGDSLPPAIPESGKLTDLIRYACKSTGGGGSGKCARYTFNHANNLARVILNKDAKGCTVPAGGNANQEGYHANLERLGWKRYDRGTISKSELKKILETKSNWNSGDIVSYWGISSEYSDKGGVKYGHTQMYTNGAHGTSHPWTSDNEGNFKCSFVYNSYNVDKWRFIIFKFPGLK
jgi:hypothetical protein